MAKHSSIYVANDMVIAVEGLTDRDGAEVTNATVTLVELKDRQGENVTGISLPLSLNHAGNGTYEGLIPSGVAVQSGKIYQAKVQAISGSLSAEWVETLIAKVRRA